MKEKAIIIGLINEFFTKNVKGFETLASETTKRYSNNNMDAEYLRGVICLREVPCLVQELDEIDCEIVQFIKEGRFNDTSEDKTLLKKIIILCEIKKIQVQKFNEFYTEYTKGFEEIAKTTHKELVNEEKSFHKLKIQVRSEMKRNHGIIESFDIIQKAIDFITQETDTYRELIIKTLVLYKIDRIKNNISEELELQEEKLTVN